MANRYDYDYERGRYGRGYYDEPSFRGGRDYDQRYSRSSSNYDEPSYGSSNYDYGRYQYGDRSNESYSRRNDQWRAREPYDRSLYNRGGERGFFERAGDEVRSWFGDEEAEQRREMDYRRSKSKTGRGPRGYRRSDERIREDINDRLTEDWWLDASDIEVSVNEGIVTLTGRVDSRTDKRRAEDIAEEVRGVTDVTNQLSIAQSTTTTPTTTGMETTNPTRSRTART